MYQSICRHLGQEHRKCNRSWFTRTRTRFATWILKRRQQLLVSFTLFSQSDRACPYYLACRRERGREVIIHRPALRRRTHNGPIDQGRETPPWLRASLRSGVEFGHKQRCFPSPFGAHSSDPMFDTSRYCKSHSVPKWKRTSSSDQKAMSNPPSVATAYPTRQALDLRTLETSGFSKGPVLRDHFHDSLGNRPVSHTQARTPIAALRHLHVLVPARGQARAA